MKLFLFVVIVALPFLSHSAPPDLQTCETPLGSIIFVPDYGSGEAIPPQLYDVFPELARRSGCFSVMRQNPALVGRDLGNAKFLATTRLLKVDRPNTGAMDRALDATVFGGMISQVIGRVPRFFRGVERMEVVVTLSCNKTAKSVEIIGVALRNDKVLDYTGEDDIGLLSIAYLDAQKKAVDMIRAKEGIAKDCE